MQLHLAAELLMREQLGLTEDVRAVRLHVAHRERAGGVERHGDHRLDLREVDLDDEMCIRDSCLDEKNNTTAPAANAAGAVRCV